MFNQCKDIISKYNKTIRSKQITDLQMKYVYNHVIILHIDYKAQLLVWSNSQAEKLNAVCRYMFKRKASLSLTIPNSMIHSTILPSLIKKPMSKYYGMAKNNYVSHNCY